MNVHEAKAGTCNQRVCSVSAKTTLLGAKSNNVQKIYYLYRIADGKIATENFFAGKWFKQEIQQYSEVAHKYKNGDIGMVHKGTSVTKGHVMHSLPDPNKIVDEKTIITSEWYENGSPKKYATQKCDKN